MVLEKAFAKFHGSYEEIVGGLTETAMRDLTGAPTFRYGENEEAIWWEKIIEGNEKNYVMCSGTEQSSAAGNGYVQGN
jgi:hypothetical protein